MTDAAPNDAPRCAPPCPICGRPASPAAVPFCSPRCADVDLNRWLVGAYATPAGRAPLDEDGEA